MLCCVTLKSSALKAKFQVSIIYAMLSNATVMCEQHCDIEMQGLMLEFNFPWCHKDGKTLH